MSAAPTFDALGLARRLIEAGATFEVVGGAARSATPAELDVVVAAEESPLRSFIDAVDGLGGWSLLSARLPTPDELLRAGNWHLGTAEGPIDVFVGSMDAP